jgi:hypothetical protein
VGDDADRLTHVRDGRHRGVMKPQHRPKISRQSSWFFDKDDPNANERFGHRYAFSSVASSSAAKRWTWWPLAALTR